MSAAASEAAVAVKCCVVAASDCADVRLSVGVDLGFWWLGEWVVVGADAGSSTPWANHKSE